MTRSLKVLVKRWLDDRRGTAATVFAITIVPTIVAVGSAVDYTRASTLKARLQVATDAAALAIGAYIGEKTDAEVFAIANREFLAVMNMPEASPKLDEVQPIQVSEGRTKLTVNSQATYKPSMIRMPGYEEMVLKAKSQTIITNDNYEIALVFDNSGSMSESAGGKSKMDAAKTAAKKLIDIMYANDRSAKRTKMSIVPFTLSVNAGKDASGADYSGALWADTTGQSSIHWGVNFDRTGSAWMPGSRFDLFKEVAVDWRGCFETRPGDFGLTDAPGTAAQPDSLFVPMFAPDEPNGTGTTYDNSWMTDTGGACANPQTPTNQPVKRQAQICKYKINKDKGARTDNGASKGPNRNCDAQPLLRLTGDKAKLRASVDSMVAAGNTNLLEGLAWGWRTISPNNPFADGASYSDQKTRKIIILLTDGQNVWNAANGHNKSIYSPFSYYINERLGTGIDNTSKATQAMDKQTLASCTKAKAAGVLIYTVGFSVRSGDVNRTLLEQCATSPVMAYIAANSSQIEKVFEEIAASIGGLRLTQ